MKPVRQAMLALLATLGLAGCRTAGVSNLSRPDPITPQTPVSARPLIDEHNRNAALIQSFEARPSITIRSEQMSGGVSGLLAMERPQSFKLDIFHMGGKVGDIGSNDEEFWFWTQDKKQRVIYYCNHEDLPSSPLAATAFRPDWIIEAMGLRIIPDEEADEITVKRGSAPGTLELVHRPAKTAGRTFTRVTILDETTHRIKEHRLLSGDQKTLLARATITGNYQDVPVASEDGETAETVYVPRSLKLDWIQEKLSLEVTLDKPKASKKGFSQTRRDLMFVEPKLGQGYKRQDLSRLGGAPANAPSTTTIRETRPAPPTRVRLGEPTPLSLDDSQGTPGDPSARTADDLPPRTAVVERYVGPRFPSPPEPDSGPVDPNSGWRNVGPPSFERRAGRATIRRAPRKNRGRRPAPSR